MHVPMLDDHDWGGYPRRRLSGGEWLISSGDSTDTVWLVESGRLRLGMQPASFCAAGEVPLLLECLALDQYASSAKSVGKSVAIGFERDLLHSLFSRDHRLTWPLSVSLAMAALRRSGLPGLQEAS